MGVVKDDARREARANVLVVNDDGITAPGLTALVEALAATDAFDVYVAAPDAEKSACVPPSPPEPHPRPGETAREGAERSRHRSSEAESTFWRRFL